MVVQEGGNMTEVIITALASLSGSAMGVLASSKLTNYRLQKLEEEVKELSKKNDDITILKEQMKGVIKDVEEIKVLRIQ